MGKLINVVQDRFSIIPNDVFMDRRLDYRSKGLLCTLLSLPNGWDFSIPGLVELVTPKENGKSLEKQKGEGKDAVRAGLQRLEKLGYLERILAHSNSGKFVGYDYRINIPPIELPT